MINIYFVPMYALFANGIPIYAHIQEVPFSCLVTKSYLPEYVPHVLLMLLYVLNMF